MARLSAEMRHINDGGWVIGPHQQDRPLSHCHQTLAGFEHRQRA
jgi:hypothetical protein